jgi:hypothetical protein
VTVDVAEEQALEVAQIEDEQPALHPASDVQQVQVVATAVRQREALRAAPGGRSAALISAARRLARGFPSLAGRGSVSELI